MGGGRRLDVVQPHARRTVLGTLRQRDHGRRRGRGRRRARGRARLARAVPFDDRAAVFLKAAELLRRPVAADAQRGDDARPEQDRLPGRDRRRLRADRLLAVQRPLRPRSCSPSSRRRTAKGIWNRTDHRPLEGFVYAITPFNFTAIGGNLPTAPALMGNVVVWKPAPTQAFAAHFTMRLLEAAGLPPGVINLVTGDGLAVSRRRAGRPRPGRHPLHRLDARPSSTLWRTVAENLDRYRGYPRIVGETGGKDFIAGPPLGRRGRAADGAWCAARSSTRGRSAPRPRAPTCRGRSGAGSRTTWSRRPSR